MRRWLRTLLLALPLLSAVSPAAAATPESVRFSAVQIYLESAEPVAAWQFEFGSRAGGVAIVGVENGESQAFHDTPYYDRDALARGDAERVIVADYSLAGPNELTNGRTRIATLHLMVEGAWKPDFYLQLHKAVTPDGKVAVASLDLRVLEGREP